MIERKPFVSIIMPSYNSSDYIKQSIESVLAQDYQNWELLITDDCSIDNTLSVIRKFEENDERIKVFENKINSGSGVSRNYSISMAKGKYIAFLDSDDLWRPNKLTKQIDFMESNKYIFTYTAYQKFDRNRARGTIKPIPSVNYEKLLSNNVIGCLTAIYNADVLGKVYMPVIRKKQDFGLWLKILKITPKAYCLNEVLADYRCDSGVTSNKFRVLSHQWDFYRKVVGLPILKSLWLFFLYAMSGFLKAIK